MPDSAAVDPFVLRRILTMEGALQAATSRQELGEAACRAVSRIPGIETCAVCLDGTIIASHDPARTWDLPGRVCKQERSEDGCRGCGAWRSDRIARVPLATRRRGYGGLLIRISDEEQYSVYAPYLDNTASLLAVHLENERQAAELHEQRAGLSHQVRVRTLELEESQARLELAVQGGDLGAWDWDIVAGTVSYCGRCASMLGYAVTEIEPHARSWERLVHPEDLPKMNEAMRSHLDGKTAFYQGEYRWRHASGRWIWILDRGQVVERDGGGRPLRMCGTHLDITERKAAEQALQLDEERLRLALDAGGMGTWDLNRETHELRWSEGHFKLCGVDPVHFKPTVERFFEMVHPEDRAAFAAESKRCCSSRTPLRYEFRIVWPDGSVHWIIVRGTFGYGPDGTPVRLVGVAWDITERRQAEAERLRLTTAIEHAGESFVIVARGGLIIYVNPAFEKTSGYAPEEVTGRRWDLLKTDSADEAFRAAIWATLCAGKTWTGRSAIKRKDGTDITIECTVSPVLGKTGEIDYMVVVYRDITDQLRMEDELRQAQKIESIGRLAAGIAHDFNNMLTPILGYTEILLAGVHPADARYTQLLEIKKAAECSRDLTRQLVAFSRKQVLQVKAVDLRDVVGGVEHLLRRTVRKNIAVKIQFSAEPCPAAVDLAQVEQILMNLTVNAQDAMPDGGDLTIEVAPAELDEAFCAIHHDAKPGRYAALIVSDTGCGMDENTRRHAFEPFFSTKGDQNSGLGLATVYGVVKQHAGGIWIDSEPGKGARFSIYFPAVLPQPEQQAAQAPSRKAYRGTETVLLVEDNDMVRRLTQSLLQMQGYTVLSVASGREALTSAEDAGVSIDLLLADVVMPDMNGRDLSTKLRERRPTLKALFMSGYSDDAPEHRSVLEPGAEFIQKPFSVGGLAAKVREVLDREA